MSESFETAEEYFESGDYEKAYSAYNKCTSSCIESGNCEKEHFLCMLEIGRMLELGLADKEKSQTDRLKKAKFWYEYCADKGSLICKEKLSTLNPRNRVIVKNIQEKLFDLGYPIMIDNITGTQTSNAIIKFQEEQGLKVQIPTTTEKWLELNDQLTNAIINKESDRDYGSIAKPSDYATGVWIGKKNKMYLLTVGHFANGCNKIRSNKLSLRVLYIDNENDLALLISNDPKNDEYIPIKFPLGGIYKNEKVYIYGYPRQTILGESETEVGEIIALKSSGGNRSQMVIKANLHLHSSGSPVINEKGLLVGIVHAKTKSYWKQILEQFNLGVTSEGHNLAISAYSIRSFLDENNIQYLTIDNAKKKDSEKIKKEAKKYTVALQCWAEKK